VTDGPGSHPWGSNTGWQPWPGGQPPPAQQPPAYGAWPSQPPVTVAQFGPPPGAPGGRNRKPLIIGLSVAAVVALVIVITVIVVANSGGGSGSAGDAIKGYLEALERGDAEAALTYSTDQPASKEFLTDDVLKQQIARWPITDIRILDDNSARSFGFGQVHVSAKFGDNTSDVNFSMKKAGNQWKLDHAAIKVDTINVGLDQAVMKTATFFGKPVGGSPIYIFPGWVDVASSNSNLAVNLKKPFLLDNLATAAGAYFNDLEFKLSDSGLSATSSAIAAALADCAKSTQLRPLDCPQHAYDYDLLDGTAAWGKPDISGIKINLFDPFHLEARFSGQVTFPLTARTRSGDTKTSTVNAFVAGTADESKTPPSVSLR
jgi:hypothetical protein